MTVTAQSIISRVRTQLIDAGAQHWTDTELLQWLSDGQRTLVAMSPSIGAHRATMTLAPGTKQTIPTDGHLLLDIECNVVNGGRGRAVRKADQAALEAFDPDWPTRTPTVTAKHYMYNPLMQQDFYIYPPNDGTGQVEIIYALLPSELTALTDVLIVQPIYQTALMDYVMYRAHQKDTDFAAGDSVAQSYWNSFLTFVSGGEQGEGQQQPDATGAT